MNKKATSAGSVTWTGKNLAEVRRFHSAVEHYPLEEGETHPRDASQHPDNLHVETDDERTLIVALGDKLVRDEQGQLTVQATGKQRPVPTKGQPGTGRTLNAEGRDAMKAKGGAS